MSQLRAVLTFVNFQFNCFTLNVSNILGKVCLFEILGNCVLGKGT